MKKAEVKQVEVNKAEVKRAEQPKSLSAPRATKTQSERRAKTRKAIVPTVRVTAPIDHVAAGKPKPKTKPPASTSNAPNPERKPKKQPGKQPFPISHRV